MNELQNTWIFPPQNGDYRNGILELIPPDWQMVLANEFTQPYFYNLCKFLAYAYQTNQTHNVYPNPDKIFFALHCTPVEQVRCVILGQDPYHNGQATGMAFAQLGPPTYSLLRILTLCNNYQAISIPQTGNLLGWAQQGVLLLNTLLTVDEGKPLSHKNQGWELFTDAIIKAVSDRYVVFILMGRSAQRKEKIIKETSCKNHVIQTWHPIYYLFPRQTPDVFSECNKYLARNHRGRIDWSSVNST